MLLTNFSKLLKNSNAQFLSKNSRENGAHVVLSCQNRAQEGKGGFGLNVPGSAFIQPSPEPLSPAATEPRFGKPEPLFDPTPTPYICI